MLQFSVVVCTRNRAASLEKTLDSLVRQTISSEDYEILVIDNDSMDATRSKVLDWKKKFNNIRYVFEPNLGLNRARNRGWREAKGKWIAYIDDDARAVPEWLGSWTRAVKSAADEIHVGGGPVVPDWNGAPPGWLPPELNTVYTAINHGNQARWLRPDETILGTNMFFRREIFETTCFDENIGRVGEGLATFAGDETEFVARLRFSGKTPYYHPDAIVWHWVSPERKTRRWFLHRMYMDGKSQSVLDHQRGAKNSWHRIFYDAKQGFLALLKAISSLQNKHALYKWLGVSSQKLGRTVAELTMIFRKS